MLSDAHVVVQKVAMAFDALGVTYMVVGSVASSFHGYPRLTNDVDFIAVLERAVAEVGWSGSPIA